MFVPVVSKVDADAPRLNREHERDEQEHDLHDVA
jgi:hypothetical protein